jgi:hypothetical protein
MRGKIIGKFLRGPIFANVVLADEINRTPPKTQAALLEAMQEHQVTAAASATLPEPFFVLATQNPIEQEGTYPLPEAQLDRFMRWSGSTWSGGRGPAPRSTWCWAPRPARRSPGAPWPTWTTCGRWRSRCCGTGW